MASRSRFSEPKTQDSRSEVESGGDHQIQSSGHGTSVDSNTDRLDGIVSSGHGTHTGGEESSVRDAFAGSSGALWDRGILGTGLHAGLERGEGSTGYMRSAHQSLLNNTMSGAGTLQGFHGTGGPMEYSNTHVGGFGAGTRGNNVLGGYGQFSQTGVDDEGNRRSRWGHSFGGSVTEAQQQRNLLGYGHGERYAGAGLNAYGFETQNADGSSESGYGLDGTFTPRGLSNIEQGLETPFGDAGFRLEDAAVGRKRGGLEVGTRDDGSAFSRLSFAPNRTEVKNASLFAENRFGSSEMSVGSFGMGPRHELSSNVGDGKAGLGYQWAGGGWALNDVESRSTANIGDFSHTNRFSVDTIDTSDSKGGEVGVFTDVDRKAMEGMSASERALYVADNSGLYGSGHYSTGNTVDNARWSAENNFGNADARGSYSDGNNIKGDVRIDGLSNVEGTIDEFHYKQRRLHDVEAGFQVGDYSERASVGEVSSGTRGSGIEFGQGVYSKERGLLHSRLKADSLEHSKVAFNDFQAERSFGDHFRSTVSAGSGGMNQVLASGFEHDFSLSRGGHTQLDSLEASKGVLRDLGATVDLGEHGSGEASIDRIGMQDFQLEGLRNEIDANGMRGNLDYAAYQQYGLQGLEGNLDLFGGQVTSDAQLENIGMHQAHVRGADWDVSKDGITANLEGAGYSYAALDGLDVESQAFDGALSQKLAADHVGYLSGSVSDARYTMDAATGDERASIQGAEAKYLGIDGLHAKSDMMGLFGSEVALGKGNLLGASVGETIMERNLREGTMNGEVNDFALDGLQMEDVKLGQTMLGVETAIEAGKFNAVDLDVGRAEMDTEMFGAKGNASVEDLDYNAVDIEDLGVSVNAFGHEAGANIDANYGVSADEIAADWDLTTGDVSTRHDNVEMGGRLGGGVRFGDHEFDASVGASANYSGESNSNLYDGTSEGNYNFAGSNIDLGFAKFEAGENANVGWDVDVNRNLASSNIDITLGDRTYDVDQGIRDGAQVVKEGAIAARDTVVHGAGVARDAVVHGAGVARDAVVGGARRVGNAASRGARRVGDAASRGWRATTNFVGGMLPSWGW